MIRQVNVIINYNNNIDIYQPWNKMLGYFSRCYCTHFFLLIIGDAGDILAMNNDVICQSLSLRKLVTGRCVSIVTTFNKELFHRN